MNTMNISNVRETVCDFDSLYDAMNVCKTSVMWKDSVAGWVIGELIDSLCDMANVVNAVPNKENK